jgi:trimethylamine--corrinoid protein Co-methyltransferase
MVNVIKPGHPMVFSNWPLVVDLRTGSFVGGGGEISVMNAASAQISNWLGLPSGVASSMTDAKVPDAQYGAEKGISSLAAALAGGEPDLRILRHDGVPAGRFLRGVHSG